MANKQKFELEYVINTSVKVLYNMISSPSGLSNWFADNVNVNEENYTFIWDNSEETAKLLSSKANEYVRFQWDDAEGADVFFEFKIQIEPLTKGVALIVTDFAEKGDIEGATNLWNNQVEELMRILGS